MSVKIGEKAIPLTAAEANSAVQKAMSFSLDQPKRSMPPPKHKASDSFLAYNTNT